MDEFGFYIKLGFNHVLDPNAYDHVLFLIALALPFIFRQWKTVVILATVFTLTHCLALGLSVYEWLIVPVAWVEFLIPVTILSTALFNCLIQVDLAKNQYLGIHGGITAFFGLIHGFGFSNYFKMLVAEEPEKLMQLLGFALGIEISQVIIILVALLLGTFIMQIIGLKRAFYIRLISLLVGIITIPMIIQAFPY